MSKKLSIHEKEKGVWFTIVTHDEECRRIIKEVAKEFPFYAYIDHSPDHEDDESDKHFHTHLIFRTNGSRSIKQVADKFQIPSNYVQRVRRTRSMLRYLVHADNPEKIQYDLSLVKTNKPSTLKVALTDNSDDDCRRLFLDLQKLKRGFLSINDFVELHYIEIQKMPFYQKIKIYEILDKFGCLNTT